MTHLVLTDHVASISDLKANPMATVNSAGGQTVAILNRNQPAFYAVPAEAYERLMEVMDDIELAKIVRERSNQEAIKVSLDEL
jgi:antitoxin StbD